MEPELTDEQLKFLGFELIGDYWFLEGFRFGAENSISFYMQISNPCLSEVFEEIYQAGKKSGAAEK